MRLKLLACLIALTVSASARVGENEQELVHRYGEVRARGPKIVYAQGRSYLIAA